MHNVHVLDMRLRPELGRPRSLVHRVYVWHGACHSNPYFLEALSLDKKVGYKDVILM